jgi:lipid-A-disaccharide synthase
VLRLSRPFLAAAQWLKARRPETRFAVALANESVGKICRAAATKMGFDEGIDFVTGRAREVMAAADIVLTASGTASLEAMLLKRPMIVAHRLSRLTYWLARSMGIARLPNFSLPNLLAGRTLVPEYVQSEVRADILGPAMLRCLDGQALDPAWHAEFSDIHRELRQGASASAAEAIVQLVQSKQSKP